MLKAKVIGIGAAGNKAAIKLLEEGVMDKPSVLLLNSTLKDIPEAYKEYAIEFGDTKGCGKERNLAKKMILASLQNGQVSLDQFIDKDDRMVIIVTSAEGGTGCGASSIIAEYMQEVLNLHVHMFVFCGFEDDARGLKNTVDWFNDLKDSYTVEAISNKKFLEDAHNVRSKAEQLANEEFAKRVVILLGQNIVPSENNIDDTDLFKLTTTPGFMTIEHHNLDKVRNMEDFNASLQDMIDNSKSLDNEQSAKRIGVIINCSDKTQHFIDLSFSVLKEQYGTPFELFTHIQNVHDEEYVNVIISGMKIPYDDIKETYNKYKKQMESVDLAKDKFFDSFGKFDTSSGDDLDIGSNKFNSAGDKDTVEGNKNDFFSKFGVKRDNNKDKWNQTAAQTLSTKNEL